MRSTKYLACAFCLACAGTFSQPVHVTLLGTDDHDGSTTLTLPGFRTTRDINILGASRGAAATGAVMPMTLSTAPNTSGRVHVGVGETRREALGPQMRASVGMAAFVATRTLDVDLLDYELAADTPVETDGPSASGVITAGFLAAMTGAAVDRDVVMTGTINPDGTIGPVGGIPEKFTAAIQSGKHRLGFPIGMRMARSNANGETVDLVKLAADHGAEAVEVADVYQAYHLLTGKDLPAAVPVSADDMNLDDATTAKLVELTMTRHQAMAQRLAVLAQVDADPRTPAAIHKLIAATRDELADSDALRARGLVASAHDAMVDAWSDALAASALGTIVSKASAGDAAGALATLDALIPLGGDDRELFAAIAKASAMHLSGQLRAMQAARSALRGWNDLVWVGTRLAKARAFLAQLPRGAEPDAIVAGVRPAVIWLATRAMHDALAKDWLTLPDDQGTAAPIASLSRALVTYQAASAASIAYLDSLVVPGVAERKNTSELDAKEALAERDPDYVLAHVADHLRTEKLLGELERAWGASSQPWLLVSLAGAELGFATSTRLVAEDYSLGVRGDHVEREPAFAAMLDAAERTARASAREARIATGSIPAQSKIYYQLAVGARAGSTGHKLNALSWFWTSSLYSQTAVAITSPPRRR